jgi:E3 ubiquitin-protein ligase TRIP12
MIKAKAKADRVAARAAHKEAKEAIPVTSTPTVPPSVADILPPDTEDTSMVADVTPVEIHVNDAAGAKEQSLDRIELLRSNRQVVGTFMQLMVPVLIDVYAASVITPVRLKTLTGLLKAVGFLEGADLKGIFTASGYFHFSYRSHLPKNLARSRS